MNSSPYPKPKKFGPPANSRKQRKQQKLAWTLLTVVGARSNLKWALFDLGLELNHIREETDVHLARMEQILRHELKNIS